uniref:Uncharacterized protein n=1 Tax=Panstrongylus lignarius TaxID=156445 RepID=A0A224Y3U5_9HEMI
MKPLAACISAFIAFLCCVNAFPFLWILPFVTLVPLLVVPFALAEPFVIAVPFAALPFFMAPLPFWVTDTFLFCLEV